MEYTMTHFDLNDYRIDNLVDPTMLVSPSISVVPIQKPNKQQFVRVHPGVEFCFSAAILELEETREHYLVMPRMCAELEGEYRPTLLMLATYRGAQSPFLWPLKVSTDGKENTWNESARLAAAAAKDAWVRVKSDQASGTYQVIRAEGIVDIPFWPDMDMNEIARLAFKDRLIDSLDHPVISKLRGRN
jgi:hypothetical protein